jgi:hypothetical protein
VKLSLLHLKSFGETFEPCLEKQYQLIADNNTDHGLADVDALICTPLVEMHAAQKVMEDKLEKTMMANDLHNTAEGRLLQQNFKLCTDKALEQGKRDLGDKTADPPLYTLEQSQKYMDKSGFYGCVTDALANSAEMLTDGSYDKTIADLRGRVQGPTYLKKLKPEVKQVVRQCVQDQMAKKGPWSQFSKYVSNEDGLDKITEACTHEATKFVLPKLLINESSIALGALKKQNILDKDKWEDGNIIALTAVSLRQKYNLSRPEGMKGRELLEWSLAESYQQFLDQNPGKGAEEYVAMYTKIATKKAISLMYDKVLDKINKAGRRYGESYPELGEAVSPRCMEKLYENLKDTFSKPKKKGEKSEPVNLDKIAQELSDGLHYLKRQGNTRYQSQMKKIKRFCDNADSYKSVEAVLNSGAFDFLVKKKVYDELYDTFAKSIEDAYKKDKARHSGNVYVMPFVNKKRRESLALLKKYLKDPARFEKLVFGSGNRDIVDYAIRNMEYIDKNPNGHHATTLNAKVVAAMFSDRSKGGFVDQFAEIQIVNSIGIDGYSSAKSAIYKKLKGLSWSESLADDAIRRESTKSLHKNWTVSEIHNMIGWDGLAEGRRKGFIQEMYNKAILPSVGNNSEQYKKSRMEELTDFVTNHTSTYLYRVPYTSDGKTTHDWVSFETRLSKRIEYDVRQNVGVGTAIGEVWGEIWN